MPALGAAILLTVMLTIELASTVGMAVTYDEPGHLRYGWNLLHGDARRFDDSKMPVSVANAAPRLVGSWLPAGRLRHFLFDLYAQRVPTMLAGLLLVLLVGRWAGLLWGKRGALLAMALTALDPNLIAHARLVTTDVYAALTTTLVLYLFWRFCSTPTRARGLAAAAALGVAQVAKYSAVMLVPMLALLALVRFWPQVMGVLPRASAGGAGDAGTAEEGHVDSSRGERWRSLRQAAVWAATFAVVTLAIVNAAYLFDRSGTPLAGYRLRSDALRQVQDGFPTLARVPLPVPYPYLEGLDWVVHRERTGEGWGPVYLRGERRETGGFPGYYFWIWGAKVPLPTQVAVLAGFVALGMAGWRRRHGSGTPTAAFRRDLVFLLLPAAWFVVHLNFLFAAQMGIRYSLLVFPLLYVLAGRLVAGEGPLPRRLRWAIAVGAVWLVASLASYFPHYIAYTNELILDRKQAFRLMADSNLDWGQGEYYQRRWLKAHPQAVLKPQRPQTGLLVVPVNFLVGIIAGDRFAWLRHLEPVDHIAYCSLVFRVRPEDLPAGQGPGTPVAKPEPSPAEGESGDPAGGSAAGLAAARR